MCCKFETNQQEISSWCVLRYRKYFWAEVLTRILSTMTAVYQRRIHWRMRITLLAEIAFSFSNACCAHVQDILDEARSGMSARHVEVWVTHSDLLAHFAAFVPTPPSFYRRPSDIIWAYKLRFQDRRMQISDADSPNMMCVVPFPFFPSAWRFLRAPCGCDACYYLCTGKLISRLRTCAESKPLVCVFLTLLKILMRVCVLRLRLMWKC